MSEKARGQVGALGAGAGRSPRPHQGDHEWMVRAQTARGEPWGLRVIDRVEVTAGSQVAENWTHWEELGDTQISEVLGGGAERVHSEHFVYTFGEKGRSWIRPCGRVGQKQREMTEEGMVPKHPRYWPGTCCR